MARQTAAAKAERTRRAFGRMRQLPSGRWQASYLHNGVVFKALATFPTKSSAGHWLQAEEDLIDLDRRRPGEWTPPAERAARRQAEKLTLRTYAKTWLDNKTKLARRTRDNYQGHLDNHVLPALGDLGVGPVELFGAQTDVSGERFRLGLPGRPFRWAGAAHVGDRKVLSDSESRVLGVFDAVDDAALGCADVAGTVAGYSSGLPQ